MSARAEDIARALRGRRCSKGWICHCPAHDDRHPSLSVVETRDRKTLVKCWSGCRQDDVLDALRRRGLWDGKARETSQWRPKPMDSVAKRDKPSNPMRTWRNAGPWVRGGAADAYLKRRGIDLTDDEARSLRFAPSLWHWPSQSRWPAMLARVAFSSGAELPGP
jgi:putative DNA primase/helicase